ncbi:acyltransferase family protein [Cronobacter malonaticus]|uniref:acyltransferase family protein n=2 Tax=Cronobacter malonaticus TaxID=413503 RepID=UPI000CFAF542|nr:acyltransferase family protein [Cronobacter malonaticus]
MELSLMNSSKTLSSQDAYRGDIDGLRTIAVVLVIFFHAGISFFSSGFIGVDIFFVISGYLITGKVFRDISNKRFSFESFVVGRLWRLQPALITVLLATIIIASYCYVPADYQVFTKSAKYTSLFLSNQFFDKQSATYASPDADAFLLIHTWSLAIEWQWYFFFALFATCVVILTSKVTDKNNEKIIRYGWLLLTVFASLAMMLVNLSTHGQYYYSLGMRAFEFLIGGSAALLQIKTKTPGKTQQNLMSVCALSIIVWIAARNISVDYYPNEYTLLVCLATALIFFCQDGFLNKMLNFAPVNYLGRISYSLYLWHWPVFVTLHYLDYSLTGKVLALALSLTLALAMLSYHGIENRFRRVRLSLWKSLAILVVGQVIISMTLNSLAEKFNGLPQRFSAEYNRAFELQHEAYLQAKRREDCHSGKQILSVCHFGASDGKTTAFLMGDSNANHFWGFFDVLAKDAGVKMYSLTTSSCLALPGIYQYDWWKFKGIKYEKCHENTERYYDYIRANHYDYVILGHVWSRYAEGPHIINADGDERSEALSRQRYEIALRKALKIITDSGAKPVIMFTIAQMPDNYEACINKHVIHRYAYDVNECDAQNPKSPEIPWTLELMKKMKTEFPSLSFIDAKSVQCISGTCVTNIDGVTLYRDAGHLTDYASYRFGETYLKAFGNPLR